MAALVYSPLHLTSPSSLQKKNSWLNSTTPKFVSLKLALLKNRGHFHRCVGQFRRCRNTPRCSVSTQDITTRRLRIGERELSVESSKLLIDIPRNVKLTPTDFDGVFVGADLSKSESQHVISIGTLKNLRFLSCFRFNIFWMSQKMGTSGREVPDETQFLLVESRGDEDDVYYSVFLPLIEGSFRACLQGNAKDQLQLCLESGDPAVKESSFIHSLFIKTGTDPFEVVADAVKAMEVHLQTFLHREEKKLPGIIDWFGWCTWDAFYQDVSAEGIEKGLKSLSEGGTPPRFIIIDDGWQSVQKPELFRDKMPYSRLNHIKENSKFQIGVEGSQRSEDPAKGIQNIVQIAKEKYNLKYVYVWHALAGYWGGVQPGIADMESYDSTMQYPASTPDSFQYMPETDSLSVQGIGLMNPERVFQFYSDLHSYLAASGVDGVKVDVQSLLETVGSGFGGRVSISRQYHQALNKSIAQNFPDNGGIACMSHSTDALYFSKQTAVVRASDDFYPRNPLSHTIHIVSVSYNSIFLGEFMQPDWDMFQSLHSAAEYHAAARAIGGCPIYVSDKPGNHNFQLLRKLVLPDGSVLRALLPGRPTHDCLFVDPLRDGKSLLKIWNMNKYTGILGVFNCQGAAWSQEERKSVYHDKNPERISQNIRPQDVHLLADATVGNWDGLCAVYSHKGGLVLLQKSTSLTVTLEVLEYEVYTITPIKNLRKDISFAPLGLIDMFNAGGALRTLEYEAESQTAKMKIHGCGRFGAYSSTRPTKCLVESATSKHCSHPSILVQLNWEQNSEATKPNLIEDYFKSEKNVVYIFFLPKAD
ncbi:hypothetical protein SUGI_0989020 [Cryptomeria japonica]|nr:hypothetical protein SUGI_0989020 [Cryptomeria japonica]